MLLNLSNHPSQYWPQNQTALAIEKYGEIQDLPFPNINPELNAHDLDRLVEDYEIKIRKINPAVIHIMGEMTFSFRLINKLKTIGFTCIASTTNRTVTEENGAKISVFEFVQFRDY